MKIPGKVRIKSRSSYEVLFVPGFEDKKTLGECRFDTKQIVLSTNQTPEELSKTFIHELSHAIDVGYGLGLTHSQIYKLENAILKVLKLNRWI